MRPILLHLGSGLSSSEQDIERPAMAQSFRLFRISGMLVHCAITSDDATLPLKDTIITVTVRT